MLKSWREALGSKMILYGLLCLGCVTISFNVAAIVAAIPAISKDLRLSDLEVSKIIPSYMIPYGIGALFYAPLTRYFSYRKILGWSVLAYAVFSVFCSVNNSLAQFSFGRIGMGVAGGAAIPIGLILIGKFFEKDVRGRLVGGFFASSFISSVVGIAISGWMPWRWLFYVPAGMGFLTALGIFFLKCPDFELRHEGRVSYLKTLREVEILKVFVYIFILSSLYHGVHNWYGVYLSRTYGLDKVAISLFIIMAAVAGFFGQMAGGMVSDLKGRFHSCRYGFAVLSVATMMLVGIYPLLLVAVLMMCVSVGWNMGHNGLSTVLTDFPDEHRPEIASLNSAIRFLSGGVGFQISSYFVEKSFGWTFFFLGLSMLLSMIFLRRVIPQEEEETKIPNKVKMICGTCGGTFRSSP